MSRIREVAFPPEVWSNYLTYLHTLMGFTPLGCARTLSDLPVADLHALCALLRIEPAPGAEHVDLVGLITDCLHPRGTRRHPEFLDQFQPSVTEGANA